MENKKTVVIGASENPSRYSYLATARLAAKGYQVIPIGLKKGKISDVQILTGTPEIPDVHTVTLYMNASRQEPLIDYILSLKPKRIIFNPGAENDELAEKASKQGIETLEACTLVMLSIGAY
jgi:uncharacterized protein